MKINLSNYAISDVKEIKQLENNIKEIELLKEKLEKHFNFDIPAYIISDILDNEDYNHFCLMTNLAVVNNRLSAEDGKVLKDKIKTMFNIKNKYDKLKKEFWQNL